MNKRNEAKIKIKWFKFHRTFEISMKKTILDIFKKEYFYISDNYEFIEKNGFSILRRLDLKEDFKKELSKIIKKIIIKTVKIVEADILIEIKNDFDYEAYIAEYLASETFVQSIDSIVTTFYDDIKVIIAIGIEEQWTRQLIQEKIKSVMVKKSKYRAETIAITETHKASSYAGYKRANEISKDLGVEVKKKWIAVQDSRTRNAHLAMRGTPAIGMNEMFVVGGEKMDRPHASGASAGNTIRCRCVLSFSVID